MIAKFNMEKEDCEDKKNRILRAHNEFNDEWVKLRKRVINEVSA